MSSNHLPASERKAQNLEEAKKEMWPFALYTAIPVIITIAIAFYFGSTAN
ncbi:MAG: hypothetical protein KF681_02570 [Bdellovibrionaceae bacterium]|nr:hypothetical protein [Pseudobdellovibrionaceae bacterium]